MFKKNISVKVAAGAMILFGLVACGNKAADAQTDSAMAADSTIIDSVFEDSSKADTAALDSALSQAADSIKDDAKPDKDGYVTTASGLKYKVLKEGTGKSPLASNIVEVDYEGKLASDGTVFDSSYQRGEKLVSQLYRLIPGWIEGVQLMKEGAIYEFYIPYNLAYGEKGAGPIPPKADLIFKVELHQVK